MFFLLLLLSFASADPGDLVPIVGRLTRVEPSPVSAVTCPSVRWSDPAEVARLETEFLALAAKVEDGQMCGEFRVAKSHGSLCTTAGDDLRTTLCSGLVAGVGVAAPKVPMGVCPMGDVDGLSAQIERLKGCFRLSVPVDATISSVGGGEDSAKARSRGPYTVTP